MTTASRQPTKVSLMRAAQGASALYPIPQAAALLGFNGASEWIRENVRIRYVNGQQRVLWADVLAATEADQAPVDEGRALRPALPRGLRSRKR